MSPQKTAIDVMTSTAKLGRLQMSPSASQLKTQIKGENWFLKGVSRRSQGSNSSNQDLSRNDSQAGVIQLPNLNKRKSKMSTTMSAYLEDPGQAILDSSLNQSFTLSQAAAYQAPNDHLAQNQLLYGSTVESNQIRENSTDFWKSGTSPSQTSSNQPIQKLQSEKQSQPKDQLMQGSSSLLKSKPERQATMTAIKKKQNQKLAGCMQSDENLLERTEKLKNKSKVESKETKIQMTHRTQVSMDNSISFKIDKTAAKNQRGGKSSRMDMRLNAVKNLASTSNLQAHEEHKATSCFTERVSKAGAGSQNLAPMPMSGSGVNITQNARNERTRQSHLHHHSSHYQNHHTQLKQHRLQYSGGQHHSNELPTDSNASAGQSSGSRRSQSNPSQNQSNHDGRGSANKQMLNSCLSRMNQPSTPTDIDSSAHKTPKGATTYFSISRHMAPPSNSSLPPSSSCADEEEDYQSMWAAISKSIDQNESNMQNMKDGDNSYVVDLDQETELSGYHHLFNQSICPSNLGQLDQDSSFHESQRSTSQWGGQDLDSSFYESATNSTWAKSERNSYALKSQHSCSTYNKQTGIQSSQQPVPGQPQSIMQHQNMQNMAAQGSNAHTGPSYIASSAASGYGAPRRQSGYEETKNSATCSNKNSTGQKGASNDQASPVASSSASSAAHQKFMYQQKSGYRKGKAQANANSTAQSIATSGIGHKQTSSSTTDLLAQATATQSRATPQKDHLKSSSNRQQKQILHQSATSSSMAASSNSHSGKQAISLSNQTASHVGTDKNNSKGQTSQANIARQGNHQRAAGQVEDETEKMNMVKMQTMLSSSPQILGAATDQTGRAQASQSLQPTSSRNHQTTSSVAHNTIGTHHQLSSASQLHNHGYHQTVNVLSPHQNLSNMSSARHNTTQNSFDLLSPTNTSASASMSQENSVPINVSNFSEVGHHGSSMQPSQPQSLYQHHFNPNKAPFQPSMEPSLSSQHTNFGAQGQLNRNSYPAQAQYAADSSAQTHINNPSHHENNSVFQSTIAPTDSSYSQFTTDHSGHKEAFEHNHNLFTTTYAPHNFYGQTSHANPFQNQVGVNSSQPPGGAFPKNTAPQGFCANPPQAPSTLPPQYLTSHQPDAGSPSTYNMNYSNQANFMGMNTIFAMSREDSQMSVTAGGRSNSEHPFSATKDFASEDQLASNSVMHQAHPDNSIKSQEAARNPGQLAYPSGPHNEPQIYPWSMKAEGPSQFMTPSLEQLEQQLDQIQNFYFTEHVPIAQAEFQSFCDHVRSMSSNLVHRQLAQQNLILHLQHILKTSRQAQSMLAPAHSHQPVRGHFSGGGGPASVVGFNHHSRDYSSSSSASKISSSSHHSSVSSQQHRSSLHQSQSNLKIALAQAFRDLEALQSDEQRAAFLVTKAALFAKDKAGSQLLKNKIDEEVFQLSQAQTNSNQRNKSEQPVQQPTQGKFVQELFTHLLSPDYTAFHKLMMHQVANFFCQELFRQATKHQLDTVLEVIRNDFFKIAADMHGTRSLQVLLENLLFKSDKPSDQTADLIMEALKASGRIFELSCNIRGNHVLRQCLILLKTDNRRATIYEPVIQHFTQVARDKHGCQVVKDSITTAQGHWKKDLIQVSFENIEVLINDEYGNFVIQAILEHFISVSKRKSKIMDVRVSCFYEFIRLNLGKLCRQQYSSRVVEKAVDTMPKEQFEKLCFVFTKNSSKKNKLYKEIMLDNFGNYIAPKILERAKAFALQEHFDYFNKVLRDCIENLKKVKHGRQLINKMNQISAQSAGKQNLSNTKGQNQTNLGNTGTGNSQVNQGSMNKAPDSNTE